MATVVVTHAAREDLEGLISSHSLPATTRSRVKQAIAPLSMFPNLGRRLLGRWAAFRVLIGPWPWMLVVYRYDELSDQAVVVTIQDSRSAAAATSEGPRSEPQQPSV